MQHWKQLQIIDLKARSVCVVQNEDGATTELCIQNLPVKVKAAFNTVIELRRKAAKLALEVEAQRKEVRRVNAVTPIASNDPVRNAKRETVNLAGAILKEKEEDLDKLGKAIERIQSNQQLTSIFAMFSGAMYLKLEVWDCGQQKSF